MKDFIVFCVVAFLFVALCAAGKTEILPQKSRRCKQGPKADDYCRFFGLKKSKRKTGTISIIVPGWGIQKEISYFWTSIIDIVFAKYFLGKVLAIYVDMGLGKFTSFLTVLSIVAVFLLAFVTCAMTTELAILFKIAYLKRRSEDAGWELGIIERWGLIDSLDRAKNIFLRNHPLLEKISKILS